MTLKRMQYPAEVVLPARIMIVLAVSGTLASRRFLAASTAAGALGLCLLASPSYGQPVKASNVQPSGAISSVPAKAGTSAEDTAIRPFKMNFSDEAIVDLRRRIAAISSLSFERGFNRLGEPQR